MKLLMLTALAVIATPALAQTTPPPAEPPMAQPTPPAPPADPAMAPAAPMAPATTPDANGSGATPMSAPMPASGSYPMCSRTVTDQCTERSNAKGQRMHSTPRPKK